METVTGGKRIFPDKDLTNPTQNRKIVRVKAVISPILLDEKVVFKAFDVDDPTNDTIIDPNGNAGDDNRPITTGGNPGTLSSTDTDPGTSNEIAAGVDVHGVAIVYLTVTMQPGNNVVIAASAGPLDTVTVDGTGLKDGTSPLPTKRIKRTNLLTTWRKLHIEVDSMGVVQQNFILGTIPDDVKIDPSQRATITLNPSPNNPLEINRFENGRLVSGSSSLQVISNTVDTVTLQNIGQSTVSIPANSQFTLYDDDDFNDNDGTVLDGDTLPSPGENITRPDTSRLTADSDDENTNAFAPAYIHPVYDIGDNNDNIPVSLNLDDAGVVAIFNNMDYFNQRATEASEDFWTIYLLGGYQYKIDRDGDPREFFPNGLLKTVYGVADVPPRMRTGQGAVIFTEEGRDKEYPSDWTNRPVSRAYTAAHEVGHLFGCVHDDGGLMSDTTTRTSGTFTPLCLNEIRNSTHP